MNNIDNDEGIDVKRVDWHRENKVAKNYIVCW